LAAHRLLAGPQRVHRLLLPHTPPARSSPVATPTTTRSRSCTAPTPVAATAPSSRIRR